MPSQSQNEAFGPAVACASHGPAAAGAEAGAGIGVGELPTGMVSVRADRSSTGSASISPEGGLSGRTVGGGGGAQGIGPLTANGSRAAATSAGSW